LCLVLGSGWRSPEAPPYAPLLASSSSVATHRLPGAVAAQRCLIMRRGHVPPPPRVHRCHRLHRPTCAMVVTSSTLLCAMAVACIEREIELGEELYRRERGLPLGEDLRRHRLCSSTSHHGRTCHRCVEAARMCHIGSTSRRRRPGSA
jgi:hypothetical protein